MRQVCISLLLFIDCLCVEYEATAVFCSCFKLTIAVLEENAILLLVLVSGQICCGHTHLHKPIHSSDGLACKGWVQELNQFSW